MPNYNLGCIYKMKHNEDYNDENIYIGSTCNLIRRRNQHKTRCYNENSPKYNYPVYKYIRENGGWDNWIVIKIHDYKCNSKSELETEERRIIDMFKPKLNKIIPTRSRKEYREDNKDVILEKKKEYYEANKDIILEKDKKKYQANKEVILEQRKEKYQVNKHIINEKRKEYREANKELVSEKYKEYYEANKHIINEKRKEYREANKELISEKRKEKYQANKDIILEKNKEKVKCDICGAEITKRLLPRHKKTQKCLSVKNNV